MYSQASLMKDVRAREENQIVEFIYTIAFTRSALKGQQSPTRATTRQTVKATYPSRKGDITCINRTRLTKFV